MKKIGILLENDGLASQETKDWITGLTDHWEEVNAQIRYYMRSDDFARFAMLINPVITDIFVSSALEMTVDYSCAKSFHYNEDEVPEMLQVEYYSYLIRQAVFWRKRNNLPKLTLHVNYLYDDLFKDLGTGNLGTETKSNILTTIRQAEGWLTVKCYKDYKHISSIIERDQDYKHQLI